MFCIAYYSTSDNMVLLPSFICCIVLAAGYLWLYSRVLKQVNSLEANTSIAELVMHARPEEGAL